MVLGLFIAFSGATLFCNFFFLTLWSFLRIFIWKKNLIIFVCLLYTKSHRVQSLVLVYWFFSQVIAGPSLINTGWMNVTYGPSTTVFKQRGMLLPGRVSRQCEHTKKTKANHMVCESSSTGQHFPLGSPFWQKLERRNPGEKGVSIWILKER